MADRKVVFIAFAIEDERYRDFLVGQAKSDNSPFDFIDMSVKEPYDEEWKKKVRARIMRSHGVIALVSKNSLTSSGQKWEVACAKAEGRPVQGVRIRASDTTILPGVSTMVWSWPNIKAFIDRL